MGGRGGSSGIAKKSLDSQIDSIKAQLEKIVRDNGGAIGLPEKYYQLQRKRQDLERKRSLYMQKNESQESNTARRPFVNSYGEATKREITSLSYNRSMNSTKKDVENFLGIKKKKRRKR